MSGVSDWAYLVLTPVWARSKVPGDWGGRTIWVGISLIGDICADLLVRAAYSGMVGSPYCTEDALALVGNERNLQRYPGESLTSYQGRVADAWTAWEYAGTEQGLISQFVAAGYGTQELNLVTYDGVVAAHGKTTKYPDGTPSSNYFTLVLTAETDSPEMQDAYISDDSEIGDYTIGSGMSSEQYDLVCSILEKWKPSGFICSKVCFTDSNDDPGWDPDDSDQYTHYVVPRRTP